MWEYQCGNIVMLCQLKEDGEVNMFILYNHLSTQLFVTGEQLLLLARGGGGCDGVWEAEGETGPSQQSR